MNTFVGQLRVTGSTVASYVEVESALAWTAMAPRYAIVIGALLSASACAGGLSPAERDFYRRASHVDVGDRSDEVRRALGPPTRIVDAESPCLAARADKAWVYETLDGRGGRIRLRGGSVVFCVDRAGAVVGKFDVYE